ncbi:DinB family protein [Nocardioides sp. HDW12B]|uniref:DinB family protein n=1 Tax=Nocardioides sp. HDW12B TaxID=2714939 RepID=UPI00140ABD1D|nr:DinB family protein [Nocardioides sp. HDW12B]QIK67748.1 DinB family protein [Nocardioides sp. HDW12B]
MVDQPPSDRPPSWDERATLLTMLDYTRRSAFAKCEGLAPELVGATPLTTSPLMSIGGVVNHLRWVEHSWIENRFVGGPDLGPWTREEPEKEFSDGAVAPIEETLAGYEEQIARTDAIIAGLDLDDRSRTPFRSGEAPTLRWVILHLVEENARHNGHLDILRETLDGTRGD